MYTIINLKVINTIKHGLSNVSNKHEKRVTNTVDRRELWTVPGSCAGRGGLGVQTPSTSRKDINRVFNF